MGAEKEHTKSTPLSNKEMESNKNATSLKTTLSEFKEKCKSSADYKLLSEYIKLITKLLKDLEAKKLKASVAIRNNEILIKNLKSKYDRVKASLHVTKGLFDALNKWIIDTINILNMGMAKVFNKKQLDNWFENKSHRELIKKRYPKRYIKYLFYVDNIKHYKEVMARLQVEIDHANKENNKPKKELSSSQANFDTLSALSDQLRTHADFGYIDKAKSAIFKTFNLPNIRNLRREVEGR